MLFRIDCGVTKMGGVLAGINPVTHMRVILSAAAFPATGCACVDREGYPWAVTLAAALALVRIPLVVTVHDPDPHPAKQSLNG